MDSNQIALVQSSFEKVIPISEVAAKMFYERLFELDPSIKPLFKGDMNQQGRKLMQMIAMVVDGLGNLDSVVPEVQNLGKRHVAYGVLDEHYNTVGTALLWTLERGLGESFTPEVKDAWTAAYMLLSGAMKTAASEVN